MNLQPIMALTGGTLFRDLQDFVREGIVDRIDEIVDRSKHGFSLITVPRSMTCPCSQYGLFSRGTPRISLIWR